MAAVGVVALVVAEAGRAAALVDVVAAADAGRPRLALEARLADAAVRARTVDAVAVAAADAARQRARALVDVAAAVLAVRFVT